MMEWKLLKTSVQIRLPWSFLCLESRSLNIALCKLLIRLQGGWDFFRNQELHSRFKKIWDVVGGKDSQRHSWNPFPLYCRVARVVSYLCATYCLQFQFNFDFLISFIFNWQKKWLFLTVCRNGVPWLWWCYGFLAPYWALFLEEALFKCLSIWPLSPCLQ